MSLKLRPAHSHLASTLNRDARLPNPRSPSAPANLPPPPPPPPHPRHHRRRLAPSHTTAAPPFPGHAAPVSTHGTPQPVANCCWTSIAPPPTEHVGGRRLAWRLSAAGQARARCHDTLRKSPRPPAALLPAAPLSAASSPTRLTPARSTVPRTSSQPTEPLKSRPATTSPSTRAPSSAHYAPTQPAIPPMPTTAPAASRASPTCGTPSTPPSRPRPTRRAPRPSSRGCSSSCSSSHHAPSSLATPRAAQASWAAAA